MITSEARRRLLPALVVALLGGALSLGPVTPAHAAPVPLTGLFSLQPGGWAGDASTGHVEGTYFRMLQPGGASYLANADSRAADKTYTILNPGTDGGLKTGVQQSNPNPAFDGSGNALAGRITEPATFFGVKFATSTNATDPQTGLATALPVIQADGTTLSGDLRAFSAAWNGQSFNQGSPKPDGTAPGLTTPVSGTYDPVTRAFALTWRSRIVSGPFNNFTGEWHLVGTFVPNLTINQSVLPSPLIGKYFSASFKATGGNWSRRWSVVAGALPVGLKLSTSGTLSGTPTAAAQSVFTLQVTDSTKPVNLATRTVSLTVPPIAVNAIDLPVGVIGKSYPSTRFTATAGKSTKTWSIAAGALPPGLKLASYGALSGKPTAAGSFVFTVRVADSATPKNVATRTFAINVN